MRRTIAAFSGCAITATLLLAGCGTSPRAARSHETSAGDRSNLANLLAAGIHKAAAAKNAKVSSVTETDVPDGPASDKSDGVIDLVTHNERDTSPSPSGGFSDLLEIGGHFYLRFPADMRSHLGIKEWLDVGSASTGVDPTRYMDAVSTLRSRVRAAGTVTIRGVKTTHYLVDRDPETGTFKGVSDIYLDRQGLVRRFVTKDVSPAVGLQKEVTSRTTTDYYDFGKADLSALVVPKAEDTVDVRTIPALKDLNLGG
jgi:hypothetical protein